MKMQEVWISVYAKIFMLKDLWEDFPKTELAVKLTIKLLLFWLFAFILWTVKSVSLVGSK